MDAKKPQISFIIVNFQSRAMLGRCLSSIQNLSEVEIILVNNDSETLNLPSPKGLPVHIIQSSKNLGFGTGINLGARKASGKYLFFLNPDAELVTNSISLALREFESKPHLSILGSRLVEESGKTQDWIAGKKITPLSLILNNLGLRKNNSIVNSSTKMSAAWVSGGGMLIKKEVFEKLNGFDENIFLYYEDVDLCRRAKEMGFDILYFPALVIRHLGGKSFNNKKEQKKYYYQSQEYYFKKHFGTLAGFLVKWLRIIFHPNN